MKKDIKPFCHFTTKTHTFCSAYPDCKYCDMQPLNTDTIFIVSYCGGSNEDFFEIDIFATLDKETAEAYIYRIHNLVPKLKYHYKRFEDDSNG
jgi:hypothetical protein